MGSLSSPNAKTIRTWAEAEGAALTAVRAKIRNLQAEEAVLVTRIKALHDMLRTFGPAPVEAAALRVVLEPGAIGEDEPAGDAGERYFKIAEGQRGNVGLRIRSQVAEVLDGRSEPTHINDIWAEFKRRGWTVPGRGDPANITAHLTGSVEIVSPKRGYYVLATKTGASSGREAAETVRISKARSTSAQSPQGK